ncbi:hypothetical protein, partial [Nocardioides sp.]|uniref:hypothetical protein n=1 Tax=Nocardioides sp. TaxID=35761 RepID=UPI00356398CE
MRSTARTLAALGTAATVSASLLVPSGTASAATWPNPVPLAGLSGEVETSNVAIAPDGTATAALVTYDGTSHTFRVFTSRRPPRGTWSPPVALSAPSVASTEPAIAIAPDGTTTIAWRVAPSQDDYIVQAATRRPGHGWSAVKSVSAQGIDEYVAGQTNPEVRLAAA